MQVKDIVNFLATLAPPAYQESYDNSGLIVGDPNMEVTSALLCLDSTEAIIDEAIKRGCQMVIAHHPIVFGGLKRFNGSNYVERTVIKAIKNDIAVYAIHTNLDNVQHGVNAKICERLGLTNTRILSPKSDLLRKLVTFVPTAQAEQVRSALFQAGAGHIGNYSETSFNLSGKGTFKGNNNTDPFVGNKGERHTEAEERIETVFEAVHERAVINALITAHPYEEVAYDIYPITNSLPSIGSGMVGELNERMDEREFLLFVKDKMKAPMLRYTALLDKPIQKVAVCGGSGSFLLNTAKRSGADIFITADYKYHQFFDAENEIIIADIGHYESEQFTPQLLADVLKEKFSKFAFLLADTSTNPVNYI